MHHTNIILVRFKVEQSKAPVYWPTKSYVTDMVQLEESPLL